MHKLGFSKKIVKLCSILSNGIYAKIQFGRHLSSEFKVNGGLRQRDAVAPSLFKIVIEDLK
jgi:hypothetical protein